ncbi:MAG: choice-of-anchor D domain-containing protein [Candidatus Cloacimonetes bacterium]|nr:choice-of-anchor D domain-containing protein [Candidatus Cloacimonadota bacterium]
MTVSTDSEFQCGDDELTVNGELEIENQAELNMDMGGLITCNDLSADGLLEINQGEVIVHNDFLLDTNGILNLDGGSLIMDKAYTGNFMSFAGTLNLLSGYLEITNEGIQFGTGGTPNMTNGTIRVGSNFRAIQTSAFQPTGGTIEFMNTEWSTIQCNNGNFFHNLEIDKDSTLRGCMLADDLTINNDLTLTSGKLLGSGYQITIGNDVLIDSDGVLDPDDELLLVGGDWANYHGSSGFVQGSGTVRLFGGNPGIILTGETFYDLVLQKSTSPLYYTEVVPFITIHVENDCYINDGKMLLADLCTLDIDNDLILQDETALRVSFGSTGTNIKIGRHFLDYNTDNTDYTSFIPEGSTVTFDGATNQVFESYRSSFEFGNLIINPSADYFYPHTNIIVQGNLEVLSGCWNNHTTGMTQTFMGNVAICDGGWWDNMGTVVFSGPDDAVFQRTGGSNVFLNVIIDKSSSRENRESGTLTLLSDLLCPLGGNLTVNSGTLDANGKTIGCSGDVTITGGKLALDDNSRLRVGNSKALTVSSSGIFEAIGSAGNEADVTCYNAGNYHDIIVENGGIIAAEYTIFQYMTNNGVYITESGSVNTGHVFNNCTFQNSVAGGSLLRIENSQDLISSNVNFPANTWGSSYNVYKDSDQGQLEFSLATGDFAGESYEHDPHSRIDWTGAPVIVVYPTYTLNFGDVYIGDDELRSMSIENAGGGTLLGTLTTPDGFSIAEHTRLEQIENGSRNTISYSIGSGNTTVFVITFSPLLEQTYEGDVIITHNSGGDDETVHVIGAGIQPPPPDIYIDPESLAYGEILIGQQQTLNLLIENTGGSNLVGSITTPADFSIYEWRSRDGLPFDIPAGESLYYDVLFEPTIMQVYNDNIVISHNAGSGETLVPCTGIGLAVNLTLNPSALDKTLAPGETDYEILSLGNDGNLELEYLAYIEYEETRTTIIDEGFELNFPPSGWNLESLDEWGNWIQSGSYPYKGSYCALASPMMVDDARLITPFFTATDDCILMYWIRGYEPEYYWEDAVFEIEVSTDGTNWTTLESYSQEIFIDHYVPRGLSLATYAGQNIQIAFRVQYNTSGCGVNIDNVKITGDSSPTYSWLLLDGNTSISGSIPAGNPDVEIQADFNSAGLPNGDYSAYIRFISNDTSTPCDAIPVTLIIGYYDMAITPSFLDFGEVEVGLNNTKQFTIENTGTFEIYGEITPPIGFQVWQERTNRSYPTTPFNDRDFIYYTLSPGELDSINVIFEPSDTLNYDDEIIINHNMVREPMIVQVSGSGVTLPGVLTYEIMQITTDSAVGGGQVLHDGNSTIIARGICWSKFTGPTIDDEYTSEGTGVGEFVSSLTSLDPDTPYFVRAYATNNLGTDYGNQVTFTTLPVTPTINVSVTSLADFGDVLITTFSGEQSYTVSGSNLTEDIIINSPAGFEISTTSAERTHIDKEIIDTTRDFSSQIILSPVEGSVSATTIYARFHPLTVGTYSDNIIHESIGAVSRDVAVNGTGTASELEITDVVWSDLIPYVCDEIVVDVTITNNGNASSSSCYLDLYYNLTMPPTPGEYGDKQVILSSIPAGDYDVISITQVWNDLEEIWQAYLQIDSDNAVIESDETNNVWGADLITWNLLPVIDDLTIGYNSGIIMLNWSYPIYCDSFNIYKSLDPYDFSGAVVVSTPNPYYTETGPQIKYFYLVKAVRDCVAPSITGDDQVRIKLNKGEKTKIKF